MTNVKHTHQLHVHDSAAELTSQISIQDDYAYRLFALTFKLAASS